jgi:hypothetical protein
MRVHHRSAAVLAALLLAAVPASATVITSSTHQIVREVALEPTSALLAFDVEDWASFIRSGAPEYQLPALGSGIVAFGGPGEFQMSLPNDFDDGRILTRLWEGP